MRRVGGRHGITRAVASGRRLLRGGNHHVARSFSRRTALLVCIAALLVHAPAARAQDDIGSEAGLGAAAALTSLLYGPVKLTYSLMGLVFGGMAWALSGGDSQVMSAVITPAVRGDYVITPSHLRGERELEFFGRDPKYRRAPVVEEESFGEETFGDEMY